MKIVATVVLYNPDDDVIDNIKSYSNAVENVYVIDNSDKINHAIVDDIQRILNAEYIPLKKNEGVAYALNVALDKAILNNADYLLTMDQDTAFRGNDALKMVSYVKKNRYKGIALFAANTEDYIGDLDYKYVGLALTSGNLVHCSTIKKIGGFDDDLFIDWVDQDLCYRILDGGYKIILLNKIKIDHHIGFVNKKKIFGVNVKYSTHSNIRYYYMVRNKLYVLSKNKVAWINRLRFYVGIISMVGKIIILETDKKDKMYYVYRGIEDYLRNHLGKFNAIQ